MQKTLLNSVSHNLRAPLASIAAVLNSLIEDRDLLDEPTQLELLESAREEAVRLKSLIGNLLDITRLDGGAVHLRTELCELSEIVAAAAAQLGKRRHSDPVRI